MRQLELILLFSALFNNVSLSTPIIASPNDELSDQRPRLTQRQGMDNRGSNMMPRAIHLQPTLALDDEQTSESFIYPLTHPKEIINGIIHYRSKSGAAGWGTYIKCARTSALDLTEALRREWDYTKKAKDTLRPHDQLPPRFGSGKFSLTSESTTGPWTCLAYPHNYDLVNLDQRWGRLSQSLQGKIPHRICEADLRTIRDWLIQQQESLYEEEDFCHGDPVPSIWVPTYEAKNLLNRRDLVLENFTSIAKMGRENVRSYIPRLFDQPVEERRREYCDEP